MCSSLAVKYIARGKTVGGMMFADDFVRVVISDSKESLQKLIIL